MSKREEYMKYAQRKKLAYKDMPNIRRRDMNRRGLRHVMRMRASCLHITKLACGPDSPRIYGWKLRFKHVRKADSGRVAFLMREAASIFP